MCNMSKGNLLYTPGIFKYTYYIIILIKYIFKYFHNNIKYIPNVKCYFTYEYIDKRFTLK